MNRRSLLAAGAGVALSPLVAAAARAAPEMRTRWTIRECEGLDAVSLLGPLSGKPFYARYYEAEMAAFKPRLPEAALAALARLDATADADGSLLWPGLAVIVSGGPTDTLDQVIGAVEAAETVLGPPLRASVHWDEAVWAGFLAGRADLLMVLTAVRDAGFAAYLKTLTEPRAGRLDQLRTLFGGLDIISEQERLLGRPLDPAIEVDLLWFCVPHGARVQGQRFLAHHRYPDGAMVKTAAHEVFHPPIDMEGPTALACLAALAADPLFARILAEKDPASGYNSLEGILNEDICQALDQIVQERLNVVELAPAARWTASDQGMHVLAAGLYGLLKADGYDRTGGRLETWLDEAVRGGRLSPAQLHPAAAAVLGKPADGLWTTPA
jgi:hypothetical protein